MYTHIPSSAQLSSSSFPSPPPFNNRDYSNNVLVSSNNLVYFLPCYLRVVFL